MTNNARIVINFIPDENYMGSDTPIVRFIRNNTTDNMIQIQDNSIIVYGVFNDLQDFLRNLDIFLALYKIESADIECFAFAEEMFAEGLRNSKVCYNFNEEKAEEFKKAYEILLKMRELYSKYFSDK